MPTADGQYTQQEFIDKFGYDPLEGQQQQPAQPEVRGGWKDHLRSVATGVLSIPTDFYGGVSSISPAIRAAYNTYSTDTKFADEFGKNIQVEGAQDKLQQHLNEVAQQWRDDNPGTSEEDINAGIEQYKQTKDFEDYAATLLKTPQRVAAQTKSAIRGMLGDERPEGERGWTESAAEVLGGAVVGAPAGWANAAAKAPGLLGKVAGNAAVRTAIKAAEVTTPLTVPYTAGNVALNAGVGLGIDQGMRYLQGKSTAFTPNEKDPYGVGTLAVGGAGAAAVIAVVGAMKGKAHVALQANQAAQTRTEAQLARSTNLDAQTSSPIRTGEASVTSGGPRVDEVTPYMDTLDPITAASRRAKNEYVSQDIIPLNTIRDIHGSEVATRMEDEVANVSAGSTLRDDIGGRLAEVLTPADTILRGMLPERARAAEAGAHMASYSAIHRAAVQDMHDELQQLRGQISGGRLSTQGMVAKMAEEMQLRNKLTATLADTDPNLRMMLPNTPMSEVYKLGTAFIRDTSPEMMAYKKALSDQNWERLKGDVAAGKKNMVDAQAEHAANPYFMPAIHDPLEGTTGVTRMWRSVVNTFKNSDKRMDSAGNTSVAREGSISQLGRSIPDPAKIAAGPERRVTSLLNSQSAHKMFLENNLRENAHQRMRNEFSRAYLWKDAAQSIPTDFHTNGHVRIIESDAKQTWFSPQQVGSKSPVGAWIDKQLNNRRVVPEWQNGMMRLVEYGDTAISSFLRQEPVILDGMMRGIAATTQLMKRMTTGYGNPFFAPVGAMYNVIMHMLFKRTGEGRVFGPIQTGLAHVLPKSVMKVVGTIPDPSVFATIPYHLLRGAVEHFADKFTRHMANTLANNNSVFQSLRGIVGNQTYEKMVNAAAKTAAWVHENSVIGQLRAHGVGHNMGAVDSIHRVRNAYSQISDSMPQAFKTAAGFYKDLVDLVYLTPQRMYYTENMALLRRAHPNGIPDDVRMKLVNETRFLGGNMHKTPASKGMAQIEGVVPYLTQTKLGAYELYRNLGSRSTFMYVMPAAGMMMYGLGSSMYWRTYWDEESRHEYWNRPAHELYRRISIPIPELLWKWFNGERPKYDRKLHYDIILPPDIAGMVAGTASMMQMMGMLPNGLTPTPLKDDFPKVFASSLIPAMPPALQALLGYNNLKLDPEAADTHAGKIIRSVGSNFRSGPAAESMSNLGQVSNSTQLVMSALLGTFGTHLAAMTDTMLHASKYYPPGKDGKLTPREEQDFAAGLRAAVSTVLPRYTKNVPDIPLLWQNKSKYSVMTPAWQYVAENTTHIRSIVGMREQAEGKAAQLERQYANQVGGVPKQAMTDAALIQVARGIAQFQNPSGPLGKLKKQYSDYARAASSVSSAYYMDNDTKQQRVNALIQKQQENMQQQHLAIKFAEQQVAVKFGKYLEPLLQGRKITMATLDQIMRDSIDPTNNRRSPSTATPAAEEE